MFKRKWLIKLTNNLMDDDNDWLDSDADLRHVELRHTNNEIANIEK